MSRENNNHVLFENETENNHHSIELGNRKEKISLMAFYGEVQHETKILFEEYILSRNFEKYPQKIKTLRNYLVYLTIIQVLCGIFSMFYILIRRSYVYLVVNLIALSLGFCGAYGSIRIHQITLLMHCLFSISIAGGFFFYQIFEFIFINDTSYGNSNRMNDKTLLLLFSVPYLYDCITGIFNYYFLNQISRINSESIKHEESIKMEFIEMKKVIKNEEIEKYIFSVDSKKCILCVDKERDTIINPCGHIVGCYECMEKILISRYSILSQAKCPICRKNIESYLKMRYA